MLHSNFDPALGSRFLMIHKVTLFFRLAYVKKNDKQDAKKTKKTQKKQEKNDYDFWFCSYVI